MILILSFLLSVQLDYSFGKTLPVKSSPDTFHLRLEKVFFKIGKKPCIINSNKPLWKNRRQFLKKKFQDLTSDLIRSDFFPFNLLNHQSFFV